MKKLLTAKQMQEADELTIKKHKVPSMVLMERAAMSVVNEMKARGLDQGKIVVVCGCGNNGADGIAIARLLYLAGCNASMLILNDITDKQVQLSYQFEMATSYGVPIEEDLDVLLACDVIVDGIFGIGLSRSVEGIYSAAITRMNSSNAYVVAVDTPSGLACSTGNVLGICVKADLTVTFGYIKRGFYLGQSYEYTGELVCCDVGIYVDDIDEKALAVTLDETDLSLLPVREPNAHKGSCGKVLVVAGNEDMSGAAYLCAKAAMTTGCGLVKIYTARCNVPVLHMMLPEAIVVGFDTFDKSTIRGLCDWADSIIIGPGLGTSDLSMMVFKEVLKSSTVPTVIDADGLSLLASDSSIYDILHKDCVVTPHFKEMSRLTGKSIDEIKADTCKSASTFANEHTLTCLLKDHRTVITAPFSLTYINTTGNEGMATAGSGDVLSGVIGSLLAQGLPCLTATALGAYIHGAAGDVMVKYKGIRSIIASDLIDGICEVIK